MSKKTVTACLCAVLAAGAVFAGGSKDNSAETNKKIVIKIGDNLPDRNNGMGAVFEQINTEFTTLHPNVEFVVESYQDQPWQEKVKIYATANQLPDVMKYWSFPGMMKPLVEAGMLMPMNKNDYTDAKFMAGSLEGNVYDGKLYGIPVSADMWVLYVNKSLFKKAGIPLPTSWEDIIKSVPKFRALGITPVVTDGKEGWPICEMYDNILQRMNGDFTHMINACDNRTEKWTQPDFIKAAGYIQNMVKAGVFNDNLTTSDYGDARNMFGQERAAMYMMGSWEMSLATDENFSQNFKDNLDVIPFPVIEGGKGKATDTLAWFGGNLIFAANPAQQDLINEYAQLFAKRWSTLCWETKASFPPASVKALPDDTVVAKKLLAISSGATSSSGTPALDRLDSVFKEDMQEQMRQLCALLVTPEQFTKTLDASAQRAYDEK
ncbi:MAG: extracellular solute-binding protein [Treponema sp.]|jgi:raffinose/stachyose/melibiose transport system substrate-binding protein|nr:extracellular solute-binding protein [Treponema sp.]